MALIDGQAQVIPDSWTYPDADSPVSAHAILPWDQLQPLVAGPLPKPLGVLVSADATIDALRPHLALFDLVAVAFPKFRDGRGFTIARTLREKFAFPGDIRAVGHVLPDQFQALQRCGFSSILTPPDHPPAQWRPLALASRESNSRPGPLLHRLVGRGLQDQPKSEEI